LDEVEWSAICPDHVTSEETATTGFEAGPRADLYAAKNIKIIALVGSRTPIIQLVV
jgi:hypothetical protein